MARLGDDPSLVAVQLPLIPQDPLRPQIDQRRADPLADHNPRLVVTPKPPRFGGNMSEAVAPHPPMPLAGAGMVPSRWRGRGVSNPIPAIR